MFAPKTTPEAPVYSKSYSYVNFTEKYSQKMPELSMLHEFWVLNLQLKMLDQPLGEIIVEIRVIEMSVRVYSSYYYYSYLFSYHGVTV